MIPRGEVGLIFAGLGSTLMLRGQPALPPAIFSALTLMIMLTTLITRRCGRQYSSAGKKQWPNLLKSAVDRASVCRRANIGVELTL